MSIFGNGPAVSYRKNKHVSLPKFNEGKDPLAPKKAIEAVDPRRTAADLRGTAADPQRTATVPSRGRARTATVPSRAGRGRRRLR